MLAFVSNGEMGGGSIITNYQLVEREELAVYSDDARYTAPQDKRPRCAVPGSLSKKTLTGGGLRLGMTTADVERVLGPPTTSGEDFIEYTSLVPVPAVAEQATRGRTVRIKFANGRVEAIRAWQVTSS